MPRLNTKTASILAIAVLLASYWWYSHVAGDVGKILGGSLALKKPLKELPLTLGDWEGNDAPLDEAIVRVAGADEYVSRNYRNPRTGAVLRLYIPYYGNPRRLVGHYPDVCYRANGWEKEMRREENIPRGDLGDSEGWPAELYHFKRGSQKVSVVSMYIVAGQYTADRAVAERNAHRPITGKNRNYLSRVQIAISGYPPIDQVLQITGEFLSELLPVLETHLPSSEASRTLAPAE